MSDSGGQEKTEKATPRKLKKVREDGGLQKSQDLTSWVVMAIAAAVLGWVITSGWAAAQEQIQEAIHLAQNPRAEMTPILLRSALISVPFTLAPLLAAVFLTAVVVNIAQGGVHPTLKKLKPKFQNFNLVKGLKKVFGMQALWQGVKALLKTAVLGGVLYLVVASMNHLLVLSGALQLGQVLSEVAGKAQVMLWTAIIAGLVLAAFDVLVVMRKNRKQTRMTKQEVKEESKHTEGDPMIKAQIRAKQMAMSRNRMMSAVADADVVIANPTHFSVALRYEPGQGAPKVIAKGIDIVALKIREKAAEARVPMVENIMLARTLYKNVDLGDSIPEELFEAVAQVLAFVMQLKRRGAVGGIHKMPAGSARVG